MTSLNTVFSKKMQLIWLETCFLLLLFQIFPQEIYLEPRQTGTVNVRFYPKYYLGWDVNIQACLIGHIYIEEQYRYFLKG